MSPGQSDCQRGQPILVQLDLWSPCGGQADGLLSSSPPPPPGRPRANASPPSPLLIHRPTSTHLLGLGKQLHVKEVLVSQSQEHMTAPMAWT